MKQFSKIKEFKNKTQDYLVPVYTVLSLCTTFIGLVGFGKPYGPFIAAICGMFFFYQYGCFISFRVVRLDR